MEFMFEMKYQLNMSIYADRNIEILLKYLFLKQNKDIQTHKLSENLICTEKRQLTLRFSERSELQKMFIFFLKNLQPQKYSPLLNSVKMEFSLTTLTIQLSYFWHFKRTI